MPLNHSSKFSELTDEQFLLIGKIVVEFSNMEFLLGILTSRLLITPEFLGRSYTDKINASALQEIIVNALDIHSRRYKFSIISAEQSDEIRKIIHRISQIRTLRNSFAHYCWSRSSDNELFGSKMSGSIPKDKSYNKDCKIIKNEDLLKTYNEAYSIVEGLQMLTQALPELDEDYIVLNNLKFRKHQ